MLVTTYRTDATKSKGRDRDSQIAQGYRAGSTLSGLGQQFGITPEAVRQILVRRGVARRGTADLIHAEYDRFAAEHSAALHRVFDRTRSIDAVANEFPSHPRSWVHRVLASRKAEQTTKPRPNAWTDDELVTHLRQAVSEGADSMATYDAWRGKARPAKGARIPPPVMTYVRRFGSWNEAMGRVDPKHAPSRMRFTRWTAEESFASYAEYAAESRLRNDRPTLEAYAEWARARPGRPTAAAVKYYNLRAQPLTNPAPVAPARTGAASKTASSKTASSKTAARKKATSKTATSKTATKRAAAASKTTPTTKGGATVTPAAKQRLAKAAVPVARSANASATTEPRARSAATTKGARPVSRAAARTRP
jgi:hypothetical protein